MACFLRFLGGLSTFSTEFSTILLKTDYTKSITFFELIFLCAGHFWQNNNRGKVAS